MLCCLSAVLITIFAAHASAPAGAKPVPVIRSISPLSGVTTPGTTVILAGTNFTSDTVVYFDGLQARDTRFINRTELQVITPYLRPGSHRIQLAVEGQPVRTEVTFSSLPSDADAKIDQAIELAARGKGDDAVESLYALAKDAPDYQVRAYAYYEAAQVSYERGDWARWAAAAASIYLDSDKAGMAVQTYWPYRLAMAQSTYLFDSTRPGEDMREANFVVQYDVTDSPEPKFHAALVNARAGNLYQARTYSDAILKQDPTNVSYRALAIYIGALGGDYAPLKAVLASGELPDDSEALRLLGEAAHLSGDTASADRIWTRAGAIDPRSAALALFAAKKHLSHGHNDVAKALMSECAAMVPNSKEAQEAREKLANW